MTLTLVTGGVRSGKSGFAESLAHQESSSVLYVAFGVAIDQEMKHRIKRHQTRRPEDWGLLEQPYELLSGVSEYDRYDCILVDCIATWVANKCLQIPEDQLKNRNYTTVIIDELKDWVLKIAELHLPIIIVTNETGLGGVAMSPLGRCFQDVLGEANQLIAEKANDVYFVVSGIPMRIKS